MEVKGLTSAQVKESEAKFGKNIIPESEPTTFWEEFKEAFSDPMIRILCAITVLMVGLYVAGDNCLGILSGYTGSIFEPIGTLVAIILVAIITAKTAVASDNAYRDLKDKSEKDKCKVIRDGALQEIVFEDLVVGDIVKLQSGDKIPADGILIDGQLKVNNSALNGEPEEVKKTASKSAVLPDSITGDTFVDKHSLFRGAIVTDGEGYLRIDKVSIQTMMGKMASEMNQEEPSSPLKVKLSNLAGQISIFGYVSAGAIILVNLVLFSWKVYSGQLAFTFPNVIATAVSAIDLAILIIVCAVPEGLPLMISLVLMQNTSKMLKHNVLVRKAIGIETAGSLNILFSDKTGTITKGQLEVVDFISGSGKVEKPEEAVKSVLNEIIANSTQSTFDVDGKIIGGNMTDKALLSFIGSKSYDEIIESHKKDKIKKQDFNSANKFSQFELDGTVYYKGAPEKLLENCTKYLDKDGNIVDFDPKSLDGISSKMGNEAKRLLAFAYVQDKALKQDVLHKDLVFVGMVAIRDDVRPEAVEAIKIVKNAGVQVVMITGDKLETAKAIAETAGLINNKAVILTEENKVKALAEYKNSITDVSDNGIIVSSAMLNKLTDEEIKVLLSGIKVIARALPTDKSRMVRICQDMNLVVGMSGDGVNDSSSLKNADVGFAMGSGTEAAKEAGDLVILDDNFKSIKDAIWFGRTIYNNILKFIKFQLMINVFAVLVTLLFPILGLNVPLTVCGLLIVNLLADSLSSLKFGPEPAEVEYMNELPKRRDEPIFTKKLFTKVVVPAVWLTVIGYILLKFNVFGLQLDGSLISKLQVQSAFFIFFMFGSIVNSYNCRTEDVHSFKNIDQNLGFFKIDFLIMFIITGLIFISLVPGLEVVSEAFGFYYIPFKSYLLAIIAGLTVYPIGLMLKLKK